MAVLKHFDGLDPLDRLDFTINYSDWLETDQITGSNWFASSGNPAGMMIDTNTFTTGTTTAWIVSGTIGYTYGFQNTIGTLAGRRKNISLTFTVRDE